MGKATGVDQDGCLIPTVAWILDDRICGSSVRESDEDPRGQRVPQVPRSVEVDLFEGDATDVEADRQAELKPLLVGTSNSRPNKKARPSHQSEIDWDRYRCCPARRSFRRARPAGVCGGVVTRHAPQYRQ
jgi:hypothetical protein